ncbi:MAG: ferritin [Spirochaetaceae bacterium]|jgi:ferritin|nr:ferritin [Spirochaetaceae bacterium]
MIKESVSKALNDQVNAEYYSSYLYLAMSAYADRSGFKGIAHWLYIQAQEELAHGIHIYQHLLERGAAPVFEDIKAAQTSYGSIREVFEKVLSHERHVTGLVNSIASLAMEEKDHASYNFILWYVNEQVEEEAAAEEIIAKLNLAGDNPGLLYNLDAEFAARTFTNPFAAGSAGQ